MPDLVLVTGPPIEPIELDDGKKFCRVELDFHDDDVLIQGLITGVRQEVERQTGLALINQTWDLTLEAFPVATQANPGAAVRFPRYPLQSVTSISYTDSAGGAQVLGASNYVINTAAKPPAVVPAVDKAWPATRTLWGAVNATVRFVAGYGAAGEAVEARARDLLDAMRAAVAELYERRETRVTGTIVAELETLPAAIALYQLLPMGIA